MALNEDLIHDPDHIQNILLDQLRDALDAYNAGDAVNDANVIEVDTFKQTITIRFNYNVVEEDDYIGFGTY